MQVLLNQLDREAWNAFLIRQTYSHFWHTWEWGEFLAGFKQREILRFSVHENDEDILGLTTLCIEPLSWFGKRGDSIPVWHFSGPILRDGLEPQARKRAYLQLIDIIDRELVERGVLCAEFRIWDPYFDHACFEPWLKAGFCIREWRTWMCDVPEDESLVMKTHGKAFREQVRQGHRRGGIVEVNTPVSNKEVFLLHTMTMVHGGTHPRYSLDEVSYVLNWSNDLKDVYLCKHEGRLIGFLIALKFNRVAIAWLAGIDRRYAGIRPANLLWHELMRHSARQGMRTVDFGGGVTEGVTHFKEELGAKPTPTFSLNKTYCSNLYLRLALAWADGPRKLARKAVSALFEGRQERQ